MEIKEAKIAYDRAQYALDIVGGRDGMKKIGLRFASHDYCPYCKDLGNYNGNGDCTGCHFYKILQKNDINEI